MGAAFAATCVKMPFDVAKSRLQNQPATESRYVSTLQTICLAAREEGLLALYKGAPSARRVSCAGGRC